MSKPRIDSEQIPALIVAHIRAVRPVHAVDDAAAMDLKLRRILDSLDMLELIAYLEKTFGLKISDEDVVGRNFESVRSVVEFVRRKVESPARV